MPASRRAVLLGLLVLAGCEALKVDPQAEAVARLAFQRLRAGDDAGFQALMEPAQKATASAEMLAGLRGMIPPGEAPEPTLSSWRSYAGTGGRTATLEHLYAFEGRTVAVTTILVPGPKPKSWLVRGFNLNLGAAPATPPAPRGKAAGIQT